MKTVIVFDDDSLSTDVYKVDNSLDTKNYDCVLTSKKDESVQFKIDFGLDLILLHNKKIELDPTTMEKIKRYNLDSDGDKYTKQIKELKTQYSEQLKKLDKLKRAINYFESNVISFLDNDTYDMDGFEEYVYDKYDDKITSQSF